MGIRHLTAVKLDNEYKIAQYGQWDGYPSGAGDTVLEFLKTWDRPVFEEKLRTASFLTEFDLNAINDIIKRDHLEDKWQRHYPELTRDTGAEILRLVQDAPSGIKLKNSLGFAGDSVFCEWAYVIDLDTNKLDIFKGFNKSPLAPEERFANMPGLEKQDGYYPVKLIASYPLSSLPTTEQMVKDCEGEGE